MADGKQTLPWITQNGAWLGLGLLSPFGMEAFAETKPEMWRQIFEDFFDGPPRQFYGPDAQVPPELQQYWNFTQPYDPWSYLSDLFPRPGGPSEAEQALLDNSLFGAVAPLDLSAAQQATNQGQSYINDMMSGQGPQQMLGGLFAGLGGQMPMPQMPQSPGLFGLANPQQIAAIYGSDPLGAVYGQPTGPGGRREFANPQPGPGFPPIQIPGVGQAGAVPSMGQGFDLSAAKGFGLGPVPGATPPPGQLPQDLLQQMLQQQNPFLGLV